jgi:hypothetical protein
MQPLKVLLNQVVKIIVSFSSRRDHDDVFQTMITPSPPDPGKNPANIRLSMSICGNSRKADPTTTTAILDKEQEPLLSAVLGMHIDIKKE